MKETEIVDLKALIYNSIPHRTPEDVDKDIFELVIMLANSIPKPLTVKQFFRAAVGKFTLQDVVDCINKELRLSP